MKLFDEPEIDYNPLTRQLTILGIKYSMALFQAWAKDGLPVDAIFQLVKRDADGVVYLKLLSRATKKQKRKKKNDERSTTVDKKMP